MVQGESSVAPNTSNLLARTPEARKVGFEALKQMEAKKEESRRHEQPKNYGAWGPVYKNKQHFASLHHC